jgi:hypothetical protein
MSISGRHPNMALRPIRPTPQVGRYRRLFGPDPRADTDEELSFHLEMQVRDYMRRGMSEADARAAASSRLGVWRR